ncbi:methyl-accepting chemotaxis protein [Paraburkholderia sp. RL17-337-BIB-A]|uniref:methyl-accepting chemotaxis protein n=1 Tax=Paraburkholderia sp. RL17-337-BIB-A TaxID=3031636 RepID=UPI0038BACA97
MASQQDNLVYLSENVLSNFSIRTRISVSMLLLSVLLLTVGTMGILGMTASNGVSRDIFVVQLPGAISIGDTQIFMLRQRVALDRAALAKDRESERQLLDLAADVSKRADQAWNLYYSLPKSGDEERASADVASRLAKVQQVYRNLAVVLLTPDQGRLIELSNDGFAAYVAFQKSCGNLNETRTRVAQAKFADAQSTFSMFRALTAAALLCGLIAAGVTYLSIRASVGAPLQAALEQCKAIALGDLRHDDMPGAGDEIGSLVNALAEMRLGLVDTVTLVRNGSGAIATAAQQIAAGNISLSARTEEQAASLEETTAGMGELTGTVQSNAENAQKASMLATEAMHSAERGHLTVLQVTETMKEISERSVRMADIIAMIDGIAFQTNILALNAAVEAARAGEQGRGFAVVAGEVRSLAQRSASAAKDVKELIQASVELVETGASLVSEAGRNMTAISSDVQRVTGIVAEISDASTAQSGGIQEIAGAMSQMDTVTQQNAALVEQVAAAAQSLEDQTQHLWLSVKSFQLPPDGSVSPVAA